MQLHITCNRFGLESSSSACNLWGLDKGIEVSHRRRRPGSGRGAGAAAAAAARVPVLSYRDLIPRQSLPARLVYAWLTDPPPVR
jgi:hypothetical protein